uniref:Putative methyltransferase n=1 Tax=viral metagenome TaxID=1070528 RepID=A0A6M3INA5_9ZZZZ
MNDSPREFWNNKYSAFLANHSRQNTTIAADFLAAIRNTPISRALWDSPRVVEFGCGTGELSHALHNHYGCAVTGVDISVAAIAYARTNYKGCRYMYGDIQRKEQPHFPPRVFLTISSNTLEHFHDPFAILDNMLAIAPLAILIVPFEDESVAPDGCDGHGSHVYRFTDGSLARYNILHELKFRTVGWAVGTNPLQQVTLLRHKEPHVNFQS